MKKILLRGPVLTASGYGVHSRQVLRALDSCGKYDLSVEQCEWGKTPVILDDSDELRRVRELVVKREFEKARGGTSYDASVQVTIPNEFTKFAPVNIGITAGIEVDRASPAWLQKCNAEVDLVIVPSEHSRTTLSQIGYRSEDGELRLERPVAVCPEGVDTSAYNVLDPDPLDVAKFPIGPAFNFLVVGLGLDKNPGEDRKNIGLLIRWFCEAFAGREDVGLVIKGALVKNTAADRKEFVRRVKAVKESTGCGEFPVVTVVHGSLSRREMAALYKHPKVKALVSLTHGEGFGLPLLEAAACGLPVMATEWSGHLDFLAVPGHGPNDRRKLFAGVKYSLGEIPDSCVWPGVMEKGSRWANPDEADAKEKLKRIVASYDKPTAWAKELAAVVAARYSLESTGRSLLDAVDGFLAAHGKANPRSEAEAVATMRERFAIDGKKQLVYTMPMSAGDVFVSTAVVSSLRKKFPDHFITFATSPQYTDILHGNPDVDRVVDFEPWMANVPILEQVFDEVYTPNLSIQTTSANWIRRGKGRRLGHEMAHLCDVEFGDYKIEIESPEVSPGSIIPARYFVVNTGSGKGQWAARAYHGWQDVVDNLKRVVDAPIVQVGSVEEPALDGVVDYRGKTKNYRQLAHVVANADLLVGIDSLPMHLAAAFNVPHVGVYGSSYASSTGPVVKLPSGGLNVLIDTPDRMGCERACYKYECQVDPSSPCVNEISPERIVRACIGMLGMTEWAPALDLAFEYKETRPTIGGYTHVLNPERMGYPYIESVKSMLGFCDVVTVVDGGSDDGSLDKLKALASEDGRLQVLERAWDWDEPGMDGSQKAYARVMTTADFLWQQDADEVVHEEDYAKVRALAKKFPKDVDLVHLPVVELWGDGKTARTDRHPWKWRMSRNDFRITHGINRDARVFDDKTGKTYAKKGMSDGCEYVDIMDYSPIKHRGFYSQELEALRASDPVAYGTRMNELFAKLPGVYHYSWADLGRKVRNFRDFWDKCWSNLYNDPAPRPRFPGVQTEDHVEQMAAVLRLSGGEHARAPTFSLSRPGPSLMDGWLKERGLI